MTSLRKNGRVEADNILDQINDFTCFNERERSNPIISLRLCGKNVELRFSERHILDLQEMLKASAGKEIKSKGKFMVGIKEF